MGDTLTGKIRKIKLSDTIFWCLPQILTLPNGNR